jgi:hypothetical protein
MTSLKQVGKQRALIGALLYLFGVMQASAVGLVSASGGKPQSSVVTPLVDNGTFTLTGSGFSTNVSASNQVYFADELEAESNGTALSAAIMGTNWHKPGATIQRISTADTYNSTRSIHNDFDDGFQFGIQWQLPSGTYDAIYTESYVRLNVVDEGGQLKLERFGGAVGDPDEDGLEDGDSDNLFWQYFPASEGGSSQFPCNVTVFNANSQDSGNTNFNFGGPTTMKMIQRNGWTRVEKFLIPGTANGANGTAQVQSTRISDNVVICENTRTGRTFRGTGQPEFSRWTPQYYIGNGFQDAGSEVFIDGWIYMIYNDSSTAFPKIVWFCNKSTWVAVEADSDTICVVQPFTTWSDTTITGTFNQGQLPGLTPGTHFWGYVKDGIGTSINANGIVPTTAVFEAANDPYAFVDMRMAA